VSGRLGSVGTAPGGHGAEVDPSLPAVDMRAFLGESNRSDPLAGADTDLSEHVRPVVLDCRTQRCLRYSLLFGQSLDQPRPTRWS
jgi:hypothetical protein